MSDAQPTILAIDDAEGVRRLLEVTLGKSQTVKTAPDAQSALAWAQLATPPDLVLVDTEPAGMNGYELCKALRAMPGFADVPVIFLAERREPQGVVKGFQLGALDFLVKPLAAPLLLQRVRGHLEQLARERTAGVQGAELRIGRLVRAMGLYERSLGGNRAQRLSQYARALAQAVGARESLADLLAKAAPVHDVGKLTVPPELLHNERALAGAEREQFERHAAAGAEIIGEHEDALLRLARTLALTHHEYWDGSGYPGRLQGNQIPSMGRVMAIVDAFESMTAAQYGGSRMSTEAAVNEIAAGAGTIFDPALVEALRKAAPEFRKVHGAYPERGAAGGEDLVIGAPSARAPAAKPQQPAAQADDVVLGAPARGPVDKPRPSMKDSPHPGGGAASADKIREAVQRAAAKAQPPAEQKPAAVSLDIQLEASTPVAAPKPDVAKRAAETPARGELEALRARVSELELERAATQVAVSQPLAQGELAEVRGELQIRLNELEATRTALVRARAELEHARAQPAAEPPVPRAEIDALNSRVASLVSERAAADAALAQVREALASAQRELAELRNKPPAPDLQAQGEIAGLRTRVDQLQSELQQARAETLKVRASAKHLESELVLADKARSDAHAQLEHAQASQAETEGLRKRLSQLESELLRANKARSDEHAQLERANASQAQSEGLRNRVNQLEAELQQLEGEVVRADKARADAHEQLERAQASQGEIESLRSRVRELESERAAVAALLAEARAERESSRVAADVAQERRHGEASEAEAHLAQIQTAIADLQRRREDAEATLTALQARVEDAQARLEAQTERVRSAAEHAPAAAEAVAPLAAPRPLATLLVVAFLFGALAMGVTYLLFNP